MATTVEIVANSLNISARLTAKILKSIDDGSQILDDAKTTSFSSQNPSDASKFYHQGFTISGAGSLNLDLDALTDELGESLVFATVYAFYIRNKNTTTGQNIRIGNSDFAGWLGSATDYVVIGPKGCLLVASNVDGYTVTASTADVLTIANPGTVAINIDVAIVGK